MYKRQSPDSRAGFFAGRTQAAPQALPTVGVLAAALADSGSECLASDCSKRKPGEECGECAEWNEGLAARVLQSLSGEPSAASVETSAA